MARRPACHPACPGGVALLASLTAHRQAGPRSLTLALAGWGLSRRGGQHSLMLRANGGLGGNRGTCRWPTWHGRPHRATEGVAGGTWRGWGMDSPHSHCAPILRHKPGLTRGRRTTLGLPIHAQGPCACRQRASGCPWEDKGPTAMRQAQGLRSVLAAGPQHRVQPQSYLRALGVYPDLSPEGTVRRTPSVRGPARVTKQTGLGFTPLVPGQCCP